jgi:glycopeptide antibiotics resistance protein
MRTPLRPSSFATQACRLMFGLFVLFAVIAVAGSCWPFRVSSQSFGGAWTQFQQLEFFRFRIGSRSDWVSNVLLFVPLGFFAAGLATTAGTAPRASGLIRAVLWLPVLVLFSLLLEFAQYWFPPRVVNPLDVQAQLLGACFGMGVWWLIGPALVRRMDVFTQMRPAWMVMLGLLFLAQLAPMDISISPYDLKQKVASGGVELIPFRKHPLSLPSTQLGLVGCALSASLMGLAFINLGHRDDRPPRSIWMNGLLLTLAVCFMEAIQVLVISRVSSTSNLLMGLLAGWLTIVCVQRREGSLAWQLHPSERTYVKLAMGIGVWLFGACYLCSEFWWPLEPRIERPRIVTILRAFRNQQLGTWLRTGEYDWPTKSKLLWYAPLGLILGWVCRQIQLDWRLRPWPLLLLALVVSVHLALALELGQTIFPPHAPDQTDLLLGWLFSALGLALGWWITGLFPPRKLATLPASRLESTRSNAAGSSFASPSSAYHRRSTSTPQE